MPTAGLADALNLFDPRRPLRTGELDAYYVARPHSPLEPMKTYLRLTQQPVKAPAITSEMVQRVAAEVANDYRRLLLAEHYEALRQAHKSKEIIPNETVRQLLENLSLLEYRNTTAWGDVNPIVLPLLA